MSFASLEEAEDHYNEKIDDLNHEIGVVVEAVRVLTVAYDYIEKAIDGADSSALPSSTDRSRDALWDRLDLVNERIAVREDEKTSLELNLEFAEADLDDVRDEFARREADDDEVDYDYHTTNSEGWSE